MKVYIYKRRGYRKEIELEFAINGIKHNLLFENVTQAKDWFLQMYNINEKDYNKIFVDMTGK